MVTVIRWHTEKSGRRKEHVSIIIEKYPRCGKKGRLTSQGSRIYGRRLIIKHSEGWRIKAGDCYFTWNDEGYDELYEIYKKVRLKRR